MLRPGRITTLPVKRIVSGGCTLGENEDVFLPRGQMPEGTTEGDALEVFLYLDDEERMLASTKLPAGQEGDLVLLTCVDTAHHGAFMDWGLGKDLLVPWGLQHIPLEVGDQAVTAIFLDNRGRLTGATRIAEYLDRDVGHYKRGAEVTVLVYGFHERGVLVVVDGQHPGLLFENELFQDLGIGDTLTGWVKDARPDGKLDVTLQPLGVAAIDSAQQSILEALRAADGFLPLHDKSPPAAIEARLQMSKKRFKKGIGGLYKARLITLEPGGIALTNKTTSED